MTDAISTYGQLARSGSLSRSSLDKTGKAAGPLASTVAGSENAPAASPVGQKSDVLTLSNVSQRVKDEPDFDRAKVDAIKKSIQQGQYPLNPRRIAESFMAIEQMIRE